MVGNFLIMFFVLEKILVWLFDNFFWFFLYMIDIVELILKWKLMVFLVDFYRGYSEEKMVLLV